MSLVSSAPSRPGPVAEARSGEWRLRRAGGLSLLSLGVLGAVGLAWDIQWHVSVGRDSFQTPPHLLIYSSVALAGLVCLGLVLIETSRYRHGLGVDDGNSISLLGVFHAPLGFVLAGCGILVLLLAAPLDNYWHGLYGLDVTLWAPFHLMGMLGAIIARLGGVYLWSALQVQRRRAGASPARIGLESWAGLFTLMMLLGDLFILASPALTQYPTTDLGPLHFTTYLPLLALFTPWLLMAARGVVARPGVASLVVLLLLLRDVVLQLLVPWLVRTGAALEGLSFRFGSAGPTFDRVPIERDVTLLLMALALDLALSRWAGRAGHGESLLTLGLGLGLALWLVGIAFVGWSAAALTTLPLSLAFAVLSTRVGDGWAQVLRRNAR